jgi:hypothetical protein
MLELPQLANHDACTPRIYTTTQRILDFVSPVVERVATLRKGLSEEHRLAPCGTSPARLRNPALSSLPASLDLACD